MIKLRPYQQDLNQAIISCFEKDIRHVIAELPTGGGKTICFTSIAQKVAAKNKKILIMTDRGELLQQAGGVMKQFGLNSFHIQAGCKIVSRSFNCYIAMSQTLRRRMKSQYWRSFVRSVDLFIIDECHKQEFNYLFESKILDDKYVIGTTATPRRAGKMRQLAIDYQKIIQVTTVKDLIRQWHLVNDDYYGLDAPNIQGVQIDKKKGDYFTKQLFKRYNTPRLYSGVVRNYNEICPGTKFICFCVNREHVIRTAVVFHLVGIEVKFIVSEVSKPKYPDKPTKGTIARYEERKRVYDLYQKYFLLFSGPRKQIFDDFASNKFTGLINAGIVTTGYDCPDCETIILNTATSSLVLLLQMMGRGSRPFKNKTHFNILDFGSNCPRLGYYTETQQWNLWHDEVNGKGLPPMKECGYNVTGAPLSIDKGCRGLILAMYKICPFCGFKYPEKEIKDADLGIKIYSPGEKREIKAKRVKDMDFDELYGYWESKKHKTPWLWRQLWYKGRENAIRNFGKQYGWDTSTIKKAINFCSNF